MMCILPRESEIENRIALVVIIIYNNCIYSCTLLFVEQQTVVIYFVKFWKTI